MAMELEEMLTGGKNRVEIAPADTPCAAINAEYFQADESSNFGLLVNQCGGIVSEGIVRLLGSTRDSKFRDINMFNVKFGGAGYIILGDDIFGGIFALNTGLFPDSMGSVIYFAPDSLEWEDLGIKLSGLFGFLANGDIRAFYGNIPDELFAKCVGMNVTFNRILSFYPPQWSAEFDTGNPDVQSIDVYEHYRLVFTGKKL